MSEYVYQEFPKWKYHPQKGGKIVQNAEEEKALGGGWYNTPNFPAPPKPSAIVTSLDEVFKPWWAKWVWLRCCEGIHSVASGSSFASFAKRISQCRSPGIRLELF
jgi:hypothetical protein